MIDAAGDTLLPGLIDSHAHMYELELGGPSPKEMYEAPFEKSFPITGRQLLRSGVTTARVHLLDLVNGPRLKREAASDCFPSPRFQIGGPGLTGGQPTMSSPLFSGYRDLSDARGRLRAMSEAGVDWVALHGLNRYGAGELEAIAGEAHRLGLRIMAEGDPAARADRAVEIGADSIEYLDRSAAGGYSAELVARLVAWGSYVVPPIGYFNRIVEMRRHRELLEDVRLTEFMPPSVAAGVRELLSAWAAKPDSMEEALPRVNERFLQLGRAGVKMAAGTDCGSPGGFHIDSIWWELETRRALGLPAVQAVASATESGAALLRLGDAGHLGVGARADFVLYRGDVGQGKFELQRVRAVAKGGVLFVDEGKWVEEAKP